MSFGDIHVPSCHCICGYTLTIPLSFISPPPHTLPYYPCTQHPPCPCSQTTIIWGGLPPSIMGARQRNLRLGRGSADSVCLRAHRYLHHAQPRPHTRPCASTTPLNATTLHSYPLPAHTNPPHSHLYFGCKLPVRFAHLGLSQSSLRTARPSTTTQPTPLTRANTQPPHPLTMYTEEAWLYPPPPLTNERLFMGRIQAPHRLASRWCPFSIHSWNNLGSLFQCMFDVMFVTHKSMMTKHTPTLWTPPWYAAITDLLCVLVVPVLLKKMIMMYEQFP